MSYLGSIGEKMNHSDHIHLRIDENYRNVPEYLELVHTYIVAMAKLYFSICKYLTIVSF